MDSSFLFSFFGAATLLGTIFFTMYRKFKLHQENKTMASSLSLLSTPSSLSRTRKHHVFPSFHGEDVRKTFLSHIIKEFKGKGIDPFIDKDIERSKSIGPELIEAIRGSKIGIVLLSRNYASSSWCLNELVEIMKCRDELGQTVMTIFYDVDPTDVRKQIGEFGKVFEKTCKGETKEQTRRWRQVLVDVATIAGEHWRNWDNEAAMIEKLVTDVSNILNRSTRSRDFDGFIGMEAHMEKMERLLCFESDEVRMIGIWGPSGIGKTTIARVLYSKFSDSFELSVFMENIKESMYTRPACSDDYSTKLQLQKQFMSQIINHKDIEIPHLGVAQDRLYEKKVLIVLDSIDQSIQLDAIAKETCWFGHGSRIIITTQDQKLLKAHGINHFYKVEFPSTYEACQIFCMHAFGQKFPKDGFEELAWQVTILLGHLPLGLKVMGSHFRGMSKQEWIDALPRLKTRLDASIQSILKFSYDALCDEDKDLFLHIACVFKIFFFEKAEVYLAQKFSNIRQGLHLLAEKSLISIEGGMIKMHNLLIQLGREIVRHQSIREPGKRQFLVDDRDIWEVLTDDTGSGSVIGLSNLDSSELSSEINISERAFEGLSNLEFLILMGQSDKLCLPPGLTCLPRKLRILYWERFQMTSLPSNFCTKYLVKLAMTGSKLQKLWEGNQPLGTLKSMNLSRSRNLRELPDLSTAINLQTLLLSKCSSLVELPSSIGKAINLLRLYLKKCTSLVELPSSIGSLQKLQELHLQGCSKLKDLPTNINLESLYKLELSDCLLIKSFPEISTNIQELGLFSTAVKEVPSTIKLWSRLRVLAMSYNENLKESPHALDTITWLRVKDTEMQELPPWISKISSLQALILVGCKKLVTLPQLSNSLSVIGAVNCESLERLECSFHNRRAVCLLAFVNCFKLNKEAIQLIQATTTHWILPGREVPAKFTYQANTRSFVMVNLNQRSHSTTLRFKAYILLVNKDYKKKKGGGRIMVSCRIKDNDNFGVVVPSRPVHSPWLPPISAEHLLTFELEANVISNKLFFKFYVRGKKTKIKECGVLQL